MHAGLCVRYKINSLMQAALNRGSSCQQHACKFAAVDFQDVYEQLVEREKRVKGQEASVSTALGERERSLQARQDQLTSELQERERRLRSHEDECLATDRQLTADKTALERAR